MPAEGRPLLRPVRILLGLVVFAAAVALLSCSSAAPPPSLGDVGPSVAASASVAEQAAKEAPDAIDRGVERFLELFSDFTPDPVRRRAELLYEETAYLNDGFVELRGNEEIARYLSHSAELAPTLVVEMQDVAPATGGGVYLRWQMRYGEGADEVVAPGMSHLRFDASGRILYHRDYWDASGALGLHVPLVTRLLNIVRSRLE